MADQKVNLKIGGDVSDLLSAVKSAMSQIQKEADKLKISPTATKQQPGSQEYQTFQKAFQATRAQEQKSRSEQDALQRTKRELENVGRQLATNARLTTAEAKTEKDRIFYATERNRLEREYQTLLGTRRRLEGSSGAGAGSPAGGSQIGAGGITSMSSLAKAMGVPLAVLGGVATGMAAGTAMEGTREYFSAARNRARITEASAFQTQGQAGQRLNSLLNGGTNEEMMFDPVRAQAAKLADEQMKNRMESSFRIFTRPLQTIFGAANNGYELGNQFGLGTTGQKAEISAQQAKEKSDLQAEQFDALKNGPEGGARTAIGNKFLQEWRSNLDFQRQQGMTESAFRTFLGGVNGAGFSNEQAMTSASGILGAGGSTRAAQGNAGFALQMQRQFDLTNAGQAIGAISGQLGSSQMSKDALIRIQAEGTRIGLNQSEFREENRKFVEMAASVINQSTATSGAGVDQLVDTLGKFMGSNTLSGQQAGMSAYQAYQAQSNIQSGPSAVIRVAGMLKSPMLSQLSGEEQAGLSTMNQADVNVDDRGIQELARKYSGGDTQAFVDEYHRVQNSSIFQRQSTEMKLTRLSTALKNQGPFASGDSYSETGSAEGAAQNAMTVEQATAGLSRKAQLLFPRSFVSGNSAEMTKLLQDQVGNQAAGGQTGRPGDDMERQQAEASRLANGLFMSFRDSITPASDAVVRFAGAIDTLLKAMNTGSTDNRAAALKAFNSQYPGMTPTTQPSTGPSSSGAGTGPSVGR